MRLPDPIYEWDGVIIARAGRAVALARALERTVEARGLRVKLNILSEVLLQSMPASVEADTQRARWCVILTTNPVGPANKYAYSLIPAPKFHGRWPKLAPPGKAPLPGEMQIGTVVGEVEDLASRLAAWIPGRRQ